MAEHKNLSGALRQARLAEASHFEAFRHVADAKSLRLLVLRDEIAPLVKATEGASEFFELALAPGERPKLWIDLISSVVMEPDYRTYRLEQDNSGGRETLFETQDRSEMVNFLETYLAHRMLARAKNMARAAPTLQPSRRFSAGALIYAGLTGIMGGVLAVMIAAILLGKLHF